MIGDSINRCFFFFFLFLEFDTIVFAFVILRSVLDKCYQSVLEFNWFRFVDSVRLWFGYVYKGMIGVKSENET